MEYMGKSREKAGHAPSDGGLYRALASGDLPAAWLITKAFTARPEADKTVYATAFNCGLCLYRLEEYEKALAELKRAEQLLGNPPDFDISEKKLLLQALALSGKEAALLPLDPDSCKSYERYGLLRVKWLMSSAFYSLGANRRPLPASGFYVNTISIFSELPRQAARSRLLLAAGRRPAVHDRRHTLRGKMAGPEQPPLRLS